MDVYSWFRRIKTSLPSLTSSSQTQNKPHKQHQDQEEEEEAEKIYGITPILLNFIQTLSLDSFKNFILEDEDVVDTDAGNVNRDLSEWQERHATLVLTKAKEFVAFLFSAWSFNLLQELSKLRFRLCPGYMKERKFWRIYFSLVKSYVSEYELRAVRLEKLKQMKMENETSSDVNVHEVEMAEAKRPYDVGAADSFG